MKLSLFSKRTLAGIGILLGMGLCELPAATIAWTNINGGIWAGVTNWSPNIVPRYFDDVQITAAGTYTVTVNRNFRMQSLTLGGASGVQQVTNYGQSVYITNSTVVNANGQLNLGAGATVIGGPMTVQGTLNWAGATVLMPVTVAGS